MAYYYKHFPVQCFQEGSYKRAQVDVLGRSLIFGGQNVAEASFGQQFKHLSRITGPSPTCFTGRGMVGEGPTFHVNCRGRMMGMGPNEMS